MDPAFAFYGVVMFVLGFMSGLLYGHHRGLAVGERIWRRRD
jgi:hypothetical protein